MSVCIDGDCGQVILWGLMCSPGLSRHCMQIHWGPLWGSYHLGDWLRTSTWKGNRKQHRQFAFNTHNNNTILGLIPRISGFTVHLTWLLGWWPLWYGTISCILLPAVGNQVIHWREPTGREEPVSYLTHLHTSCTSAILSCTRFGFLIYSLSINLKEENSELGPKRMSWDVVWRLQLCCDNLEQQISESKDVEAHLRCQAGTVCGSLGDCSKRLGDKDSAISYYQKSIGHLEAAPDHPEVVKYILYSFVRLWPMVF